MTKLLLIDDEESIIRVLSISLQSDGYEVLTAYNGESGLRLYDEESPDIVLTDIKMPGIDGIEVLRRIKEINPDSEVIVITGHGDMDIAIEALQHGASDFINKPVRQDALTVSLERAQEKVAMKRKLRDYTLGLETRINNATEDLRRQSEFLSKLISSSDNGIIASDEHGTIIIFNSGAERIFGYRAADVINKFTIFDIYPPNMSDQFRRHLAKPREETDWMKWKPTITVDLTVTALEEGTGRNEGRLGALVCEGVDDGRDIKVNVGSGLSDSDRDSFWADQSNVVGSVVEVKADVVTQNQDGTYSLRFPRFVRFRGMEPGEKL